MLRMNVCSLAAASAAILLFTNSTTFGQVGGIFGAGGFGGGVAGAAGGQFGQGGLLGLGGQQGGQLGQQGQQGQQGQAGQAGQAGLAGGIMIDAQGVVTPVFSKSRSAALERKRKAALAGKYLPRDLNRFSKMRMISLVGLEKACEQYARTKKHVPLEIQYLAGLQRIDYVFVDPEKGDVVIAGPAEGFAPDSLGRIVGVTTGRPPLRADDLVIAIRALHKSRVIGCTIDPQPERLAAMIKQNKNFPPARNLQVAMSRFAILARTLGNQNVEVWGVPAESHFGQALVEADYIMKLICIGRKRVRLRGFYPYLAVVGTKANTMQRWWFEPLYDAFHTNRDETVFQFTGQRAQLKSQQEQVDGTGKRSPAKRTRKVTVRYARMFTEKFPELAERVPVFAELQNLMDLAILAALLEKKKLPEKVGWKMSLFLDPDRGHVIKGHAPRQVPSTYNYKISNRRLVTGLVNGGVKINPRLALDQIEFQKVARGPAIQARQRMESSIKPPSKDRWWWD